MNKETWNVLGAAIAILFVSLAMAYMSGCGREVVSLDVEIAPEPNESPQWGNGDLPAEFQEFFGDSNGARLDFMQNRVIDRHNDIIVEIAKRVLMLEGADPNDVRLGKENGG